MIVKKEFISVIIPTYNRSYQLSELMESLFRQTYKNFEVIIVNDAGSDVSFIKDLYPELDINIINQKRNLKDTHARNRGLKEAKGEWIMLMDDDDLILPNHMKKMVQELKKGYDLVYSEVEIFNYILVNNVRNPTKSFLFSYEHDLGLIRKFNTFISTGCLYKKEIYTVIGEFDPEVQAYWDWDFILRVCDHFQVKKVTGPTALYAFSEDGNNQSGDHAKMKPYLDKLCMKHGLGDLPTKNFFLLLEEPYVKQFEVQAVSEWDKSPFIARIHRREASEVVGNSSFQEK